MAERGACRLRLPALLSVALMLFSLTSPAGTCLSQSDDAARRSLTWPTRLKWPSSPPSDFDTGQGQPEDDPVLRYSLRVFGREMTLALTRDREFVAPIVRVESVHSNFSEINPLGRNTARCLYTGTVEGDPASSVAVSLCKGMTGTIRTAEGHYLIWPAEQPAAAGGSAHVVQWYPAAAPNPGQLWLHVHKQRFSDEGRRRRRSVSEPHFIEVMVAADAKMVQYHGDQLQQYILTLMSVVGQIYKDPSIGNSITITVVRIVLIDKDVLETGKQHSWKNGKSASALLHRFCHWQQQLNDDGDTGAHFDTAVLLTRENICRNPRLQRCDTLGLAELGTMCDPKSSCSIIQDNGLSAAFTVAHELGHVLNIPHDDDFKCKEFMGPDKTEYAMSRMLNHNTHPWSWSNCSRHFLTDYLEGDYGRCLKNRPQAPSAMMLRRSGAAPQPMASRRPRVRHPGERYNASSQCQFLFGKEFKVCSYMPVCKRLWCTSGEEEAGCRTQHMPWADGTVCARGRWCIKGSCVARRKRAKMVDGGWGGWGPWGSCSRTCGGGVRRSERQCDSPRPANGGDYCLGQRIRYDSCNRQECPADSIDFRELQCATFNGNNFNIKGLPSDVTWIPKYTGIKPEDRCKLFCRVADSSAYYLLKDKVLDGTKCTPDTDDMCVSGTCRSAGCDHVLGSSVRSDLCGVCGGDNSTCRVIHSRFAGERTRYGYNRVVRIPAGATRLDVRQAGPDGDDDAGRDDNYLALKSPASGQYILNGNFVVSMFKKVLQFGGVLIEYTGSDAQVERINCSKPIEEDLELYVLSVGDLVPPEVTYEYVVSVGETETYRWQLADLWTDCDRVCNGVQFRRSECVRSSDLIRVSANHCKKTERPDDKRMECNAHCQLKWEVTHRSECSSTCGPGVRQSVVRCFQKFPMYTMAPIGDQFCQHVADRPPDSEPCHGSCTGSHWQFSDWSPCSRSCGGGTQLRSASCVSSEGVPAPETSCDSSEKLVQRDCSTIECPQWHSGNWTECSRTCGEGQQLRPLWCWQQDHTVDESLCDVTAAPARVQTCQMAICARWKRRKWQKCSVTCGVGVEERSVDCVTPEDTVVDDELCQSRRPSTSRVCSRPDCRKPDERPKAKTVPRLPNTETNLIELHRNHVWRWGRWSKCSRRCGDGMRSRSVVCYDSLTSQPLSEDACSHVERPLATERCRVRFCGAWNSTQWSQCNAECGQGLERREVRCVSVDTGLPLTSDQCDSLAVPETERACQNERACPLHDEPLNEHWIKGAWGACSVSCGGGLQQRLVLCRGEEDSPGCGPEGKPNRTRPCNTEECPFWQTSEWGECSVSCGPGTRLRQVQCQRRLGGHQPDHQCSTATRPEEVLPCRRPDCPPSTGPAGQPFNWRVSAWSKCSKRCGPGAVRTRSVTCVKVASGVRVPYGLCAGRRPRARRRCRPRRCAHKWVASAWSKCSRSCGKGVQYRQVTCHRTNALAWSEQEAAEADCAADGRPAAARRCERSCSRHHRWKSGPWSKCSKPCGPSGMKYRKVRCYTADGRRVSRRRCPKRSRPRHRRRCNRRPCGAASCRQVQKSVSAPRDGSYQLVVGGRNVTVYCHDMSGTEPREFLTLPRQRGRRYYNYAEVDPKRLLKPDTCPYNGTRIRPSRCDVCSTTSDPNAGMTIFKRVRFNITSLTIIPRDFTFTQQIGGRPVGFGEAGDCYSSGGCPQGRFRINLSGTGFRVAPEVQWLGDGNQVTVRVTRDKAGTVVRGLCGGLCGRCRVHSAGGIRLEPVPR